MDTSRPGAGVEKQRNRAIICEADKHRGLKYARLDVTHLLSRSLNKKFKKGFGCTGIHGFRKGGAPTFATVPIQGKLRNHEKLTPYVKERLIHPTYLRLEDPQVHDLVYHPVDVTNGIVLSDAQKNEEPSSDAPHALIRNLNSSLAHSLDNRPHARHQ